uniref:Ig-like domain-containing protein n=1 Tax=Lates calcarifer TaxID=8187 RepID=A0A4W6DRK5_LATCA
YLFSVSLVINVMLVANVDIGKDQKDGELQLLFLSMALILEVMRKLKELTPTNASSWESSTRSRTIKTAYPSDSGEYWCEDGKGDRSNAVNIIVTGMLSKYFPSHHFELQVIIKVFYVHIMVGYKGNMTIHSVSRSDEGLYRCSISGSGESAETVPVILESPGLPVMEGDDVTLSCVNKITTDVTADFYKNSLLLGRSSTGNITICSVSRSDEGLYRCSISGAGESAESRLTKNLTGLCLLLSVLVLVQIQIYQRRVLSILQSTTGKTEVDKTLPSFHFSS